MRTSLCKAMSWPSLIPFSRYQMSPAASESRGFRKACTESPSGMKRLEPCKRKLTCRPREKSRFTSIILSPTVQFGGYRRAASRVATQHRKEEFPAASLRRSVRHHPPHHGDRSCSHDLREGADHSPGDRGARGGVQQDPG